MRSTLVGLIAIAALAALPSKSSAQHRLDLTKLDPPIRSEGKGVVLSAGARGIEGQKLIRLPVQVRLTWLSRSDFILGGHVVSEVMVQNVGQSPITLPWSPLRHSSPEVDLLERKAYIGLVVSDQGGGKHILSVVALFGSSERQGSLLELLPGETATIRAPGWFTTSSSELKDALSFAPQQFELRAALDVSIAAGDWAQQILSENAIPISIRLPNR